jgi:hypothetical protein
MVAENGDGAHDCREGVPPTRIGVGCRWCRDPRNVTALSRGGSGQQTPPAMPEQSPPPADTSAARATSSGDALVLAPGRSTWALIRDALRGTHIDYTKGATGQAILILAIPMVLEMSMESIFAVVDVFFVSRLARRPSRPVGLTESMLTLVYTLAMGLGHRRHRHGLAPHRRARSRGRLARGDAGHLARRLPVGHVRRGRGGPCPAAAGTDGGRARGHRHGEQLHPRDARRQRERPHALPAQRDLPWCGRRGHRHAHALAGQRDQHRPRPLPHFRARPLSRDGGDRRGGRDDDRARDGGALRALPPSCVPGDACTSPRATCASSRC